MRGKAAVVIFAAVLLFAGVSSAHRIDEYLQATLLSVEVGRIQASMRLIPGVLVAAQVIAAIDSNGDGIFSEGEKRAYAQRVVDDLSLAIDGSSVNPAIISWNYPEPAQMREGLGEIHIEYKADLPYSRQNRGLILTNRHVNSSSVYLVNALVPQDPSIRILAQKRNERQSTYELDYQQIAPVDGTSRKLWDNVSAWLSGVQFFSLFRLGMHHIAEGNRSLALSAGSAAPGAASPEWTKLGWSVRRTPEPAANSEHRDGVHNRPLDHAFGSRPQCRECSGTAR